jgi:endonuclease/exonuclease/phosphatase (EEP) superfamily protein YafD
LNLAVAALVLVTAAALAARLWWAFDLLSHFRLQYLAAAVALGVLARALRAFPAVIACILVALVHGWAVRDLWLGAAPVPPGGVPLRVATANVLDSNPTPGRVLDFVRGSGADLVILVDARGERWRPVLAAVGELYRTRRPSRRRGGASTPTSSRR